MARRPAPVRAAGSTLRETRIDLDAGIRGKLVELLNQQLADAIDLKLQAKQAHWNVRGLSFSSLHRLFDDVADAADQFVDELAERCVQLGGVADGTIDTVQHRSKLPPFPTTISDGSDHVQHLATSLAAFGAGVRAAIEVAGGHGDQATVDLFTEIVRSVDKHLWMVEAHAG